MQKNLKFFSCNVKWRVGGCSLQSFLVRGDMPLLFSDLLLEIFVVFLELAQFLEQFGHISIQCVYCLPLCLALAVQALINFPFLGEFLPDCFDLLLPLLPNLVDPPLIHLFEIPDDGVMILDLVLHLLLNPPHFLHFRHLLLELVDHHDQALQSLH